MSGSAIATLSQLNNYPAVVAQFQQRLVWAGSYQQPSTYWMSQPGNFYNHNTSVITRDSDALTGTITAPPPGSGVQVNAISAIVPMPSGMLVFTSGGAWQVSGGQDGAAITPGTQKATAQAFTGISAAVTPLPIGYHVLYVQASGATVRDIAYSFYENVYTGADLTLLADHLFTSRTVVDWCWAEEPFKLVWLVRDDGILLSLTYLKEQEVYAWAHHDTQGLVESVTSVIEGSETFLYLVVRRYLNGAWTRTVERMASRKMGDNPAKEYPADPALAWCVDCGLAYPRPLPAATLSPSAATGLGVSFTASADVFAVGDIGKTLRVGGGIATIKTYATPRLVTADITSNILAVLQDDPTSIPIPVTQGNWSMTMPTQTVTGLDHLEGKLVSILADGRVEPKQTVVGGAVTLTQAATVITVGLGFAWQLQTLPLVTPGPTTTKGKRRTVSSISVLFQDAGGLEAGCSFDDLKPMMLQNPSLVWNAIPELFCGEARINTSSEWNTYGQICLQGSDPLPCTVLAVIPEILFGDT